MSLPKNMDVEKNSVANPVKSSCFHGNPFENDSKSMQISKTRILS